jgi:trans-aconitate 2-methyltransferase
MLNPSGKYQWNAGDYAAHSSVQLEWAEELIAKLHLEGNEGLIDISCGDGKVSARIAASLPSGSVISIDSSNEMIQGSQAAFPQGHAAARP